jgi:subtilase family serine protease
MFSSWSGDISGTSNPVTLTIYNNKTITANFTELIGPDLTGSWTTPVTQTCKSTKKGPKCTITGILTVKNFGNRDASSSTVKFYLSDSNTYDQADTQLKSTTAGKIKAKQIKSIKLSKSFPLGQIVTDKYIIAVIDKYNAVKEVDETNNIIVFGPIQ